MARLVSDNTDWRTHLRGPDGHENKITQLKPLKGKLKSGKTRICQCVNPKKSMLKLGEQFKLSLKFIGQ